MTVSNRKKFAPQNVAWRMPQMAVLCTKAERYRCRVQFKAHAIYQRVWQPVVFKIVFGSIHVAETNLANVAPWSSMASTLL